ncbi:MAG: ABC transporter substrate-binding protein [Patescibacteria group bacterium]|nr:ABC transporter substrate-binding protein [Patescibacteria group bacterium]
MHSIKKIIASLSKKERLLIIVLIIVFALSLVSFIAININEQSTFMPVQGGHFIEGFIGQPIAINPIISNNQIDLDISALIYSRLFDLLAQNEITDDGRSHIFKLKNDLVWDNGEPLTSDDVIFTIKTIQDPTSHSPLAKNWEGVVLERLSELQIKMTLAAPYTFLMEGVKRLPILPKHIFGNIPPANLRLSAFNLEPIGSGPYRFKKFSKRRDGFITNYHLVVNEKYFGEKPYINDFYFNFYENINDLTNAFRLRQVNGFGSLLPPKEEIKQITQVKLEKITMPKYYALFFNSLSNRYLKSENLRLALTSAINRNEIIKEFLNGDALIINSPFLEYFKKPWADIVNGPETEKEISEWQEKIKYNPEKAKEYFENWQKQNKKAELTLNVFVPKIDFLEKIANSIAQSWQTIGIEKITINVIETENILDDVIKTRNYDILLFGNVLENPEDFFPFWHSSQRFYPGLNLSLYQNQKADKIIENIRQKELTEYERYIELKKLENLILEENPAVFLFSMPYFYIHTDRLEGFTSDLLITPADRFRNINKWNVARVRVIK